MTEEELKRLLEDIADEEQDAPEGAPLQTNTLISEGQIIVAFSRKIRWMGMTPDEARAWAENLLKLADELDPAPVGTVWG